ncbi:MAG: hypothetical protein ACRC5M_03420, partial [Anaeroplasmataceae bacterium]
GGVLSGYVMTIVIKITDQEYLGKVNGLTATVMYLGMMIGTISSGIILKASSIVVAFSIASIAIAICTYILYNSSKKGLLSDI